MVEECISICVRAPANKQSSPAVAIALLEDVALLLCRRPFVLRALFQLCTLFAQVCETGLDEENKEKKKHKNGDISNKKRLALRKAQKKVEFFMAWVSALPGTLCIDNSTPKTVVQKYPGQSIGTELLSKAHILQSIFAEKKASLV